MRLAKFFLFGANATAKSHAAACLHRRSGTKQTRSGIECGAYERGSRGWGDYRSKGRNRCNHDCPSGFAHGAKPGVSRLPRSVILLMMGEVLQFARVSAYYNHSV